jgi:hypothetical protein
MNSAGVRPSASERPSYRHSRHGAFHGPNIVHECADEIPTGRVNGRCRVRRSSQTHPRRHPSRLSSEPTMTFAQPLGYGSERTCSREESACGGATALELFLLPCRQVFSEIDRVDRKSLRRYWRVTPAFQPRRFSSTPSADGCKRGVRHRRRLRRPSQPGNPHASPLSGREGTGCPYPLPEEEGSCPVAQAGTAMRWRARNGAMASATPRGSLSCSAWFEPASTNGSVCGSHSRSRS